MSRKRSSLKISEGGKRRRRVLAFPSGRPAKPGTRRIIAFAAKLLLDIASQWQLGRNGDASTAFEKVLRARGWRSKATLHNALRELRESGLVVQTRQGSLHQCSLYALGWLAIDECGGKLDMQPTTRPLNHWQDPIKPHENKASSTPRVPKPSKITDLCTPRVPDG